MKRLLLLSVLAALFAILQDPAQAAPPKPVAFKDMKIDFHTFKKRETSLAFGDLKFTLGLDTPHFLIAGTAKVKTSNLTVMADTCERIYTRMAGSLPVVEEALGKTKLLVLIVENREQMESLGSWLVKNSEGGANFGNNWSTLTIAGVRIPAGMRTQLGVMEHARVFRQDGYKGEMSRVTWPERIHFITSSLYYETMDAVERDGRFGWNGLESGYSFYMEWIAAGKIETEVQYGGSDRSVEGFKKGKIWHATLRKLMEGGAKPDLDTLLSVKVQTAHPVDVGFLFALAQFCHTTPERLLGYDSLLRQARETKKAPDPEAFARALGFDSADAFNTAMIAWMKSSDFR